MTADEAEFAAWLGEIRTTLKEDAMTATTTTTARRTRAQIAADKLAADPKPGIAASALNEATTQARLAAAKSSGSSARNVLGSNRPAASKPTGEGNASRKPAARKPAASKSTAKPAAAKTTKTAEPKAPKRNANMIVGAALIKAGADLAASWKPERHDGISADEAREMIGRWLAYLPSSATWDDRLGPRSDAGRRRTA